jgi:hypothetical protein
MPISDFFRAVLFLNLASTVLGAVDVHGQSISPPVSRATTTDAYIYDSIPEFKQS